MLLGPDQEETTPDHLFNIDMYDSNKNNPGRVNTQNMEDWSVLAQRCAMQILLKAIPTSW